MANEYFQNPIRLNDNVPQRGLLAPGVDSQFSNLAINPSLFSAPPPLAPAISPLAASGQDRANAFLKGLGQLGSGLIMAGAPSTDPSQFARGIAQGGQGFGQAFKGSLDQSRARNVQNLNLQMAQAKAARDLKTYENAERRRKQIIEFAETAAKGFETSGDLQSAARVRANPEEFIKNVYAKQLEQSKGKLKDRYMPVSGLGMADLVSGIVYTAQGPFRMGPKVTPTSEEDVPPRVPVIKPKGTGNLSPQAAEELEVKKIEKRIDATEAEKEVDKQFADDYNENIGQGGMADATKQIQQLAEVKRKLETTKGLTGPLIGLLPDSVKPFVVPEAAAAQDAVEEVVQRNLRLILGAQFTAEEGKRLIARAYNPALSQAENSKRLGRLLESMQSALAQKLRAYQYYEKNRTMRGYKGASKFNVDDILNAAKLNKTSKKQTVIKIRRIK